jgi:hypothetical protein
VQFEIIYFKLPGIRVIPKGEFPSHYCCQPLPLFHPLLLLCVAVSIRLSGTRNWRMAKVKTCSGEPTSFMNVRAATVFMSSEAIQGVAVKFVYKNPRSLSLVEIGMFTMFIRGGGDSEIFSSVY